jgi:hypothetical protein
MGKVAQTLFFIFLTFAIAFADDTGSKFVSVGMQKDVIVSAMEGSGWESRSEMQSENNLYYQYKPLSQVLSIHPDWIDSYYEFVFKGDNLIEINWYKKDGELLQGSLDKVQVKL